MFVNFKSWDGKEVWINPTNVVAVIPHFERGGHATLVTTARDDDEGPFRIAVRGEVAEVAQRLSQ